MARQNRLRGIGFVICFALKADQTVEALETLMVVENLPKLSGIIPAGEHDCVVPGWRVLESFSRSPLSGTSATSCKSPRFESRLQIQKRKQPQGSLPLFVPRTRLELTHHCWNLDLNQARLPIPPSGLCKRCNRANIDRRWH